MTALDTSRTFIGTDFHWSAASQTSNLRSSHASNLNSKEEDINNKPIIMKVCTLTYGIKQIGNKTMQTNQICVGM